MGESKYWINDCLESFRPAQMACYWRWGDVPFFCGLKMCLCVRKKGLEECRAHGHERSPWGRQKAGGKRALFHLCFLFLLRVYITFIMQYFTFREKKKTSRSSSGPNCWYFQAPGPAVFPFSELLQSREPKPILLLCVL